MVLAVISEDHCCLTLVWAKSYNNIYNNSSWHSWQTHLSFLIGLECCCTHGFAYLFVTKPKGEGPRSHSDPSWKEALV